MHGINFERGSTAIIDIYVTDLDSAGSRTRAPDKVLLSQETAKKNKYLAACEAQRCSFTPFVVSTNGLFGTEAEKLRSHFATLLSIKQQHPYPPVKAKNLLHRSVSLAKATLQPRPLTTASAPPGKVRHPTQHLLTTFNQFYGASSFIPSQPAPLQA